MNDSMNTSGTDYLTLEDFKTQVQVIRSLAQIAGETVPADEKLTGDAKQISGNLERITSLVYAIGTIADALEKELAAEVDRQVDARKQNAGQTA